MEPLSHLDQSSWVKKFFRRLLWLTVILTVLFLGGWCFENWRGGGEWRKAKERAAKMGVSLKLEDYAAEEIPEGERLMEDPVFLAEWRGEIEPRLARISEMELEGLKTRGIRYGSSTRGRVFELSQFFEEEVSEKEAAKRLTKIYKPVAKRLRDLGKVVLEKPAQDIGVRTDDYFRVNDEFNPILSLKKLSNAYRDFGVLSLRNKDSKTALFCCQVVARLAQNSSQPALIDLLVSESCLSSISDLVWEGVRLHQWNVNDLEQLALLFPTEPSFETLQRALEYESALVSPSVDQAEKNLWMANAIWNSAFGNEEEKKPSLLEKVEHWMNFRGPEGWQNWRKATVLNMNLDTLDHKSEWGNPSPKIPATVIDINDPPGPSFHPLARFRDTHSSGSHFVHPLQRNANHYRVIRIAIELEKFYLSKRKYPSSIDDIVIPFSLRELTDLKERDLQYERTNDAYFQIWSENMKEKDKRGHSGTWRFSEGK